MGKQIGQSVNSATSPPAPAIRRARATCEVLRGLTYSAAPSACPLQRANAFGVRAGDDDDLVLTPDMKFNLLD